MDWFASWHQGSKNPEQIQFPAGGNKAELKVQMDKSTVWVR